jgi:hypothetical protein
VLFGQHGPGQSGHGVPVGEDLDHVGAAFDLPVEPLDRIVGPDLGGVEFSVSGAGRSVFLPGG